MKKYYLVIESKLFVDPHGEVNYGGCTKEVEYTDRFEELGLDLSKTYNDDLEEVDENDYEGSEDGYNSSYIELNIREITEKEYIDYKMIIDSYNELKTYEI